MNIKLSTRTKPTRINHSMTLRAIHPSAMSAEEIEDYMAFVIAGGKINAATMPALVTQAMLLGKEYPSRLDPVVSLSLFGRSVP